MSIGNRPPSVRADGRGPTDLRPVSFQLGVQKWAEGSCRVRFGDTEVLCAATIVDRVRAELGRLVSHPSAIQVRVNGRTVTLVGDVLADEDKQARHAIKRIPGVKNVDTQWTVHEEPGSVPTLQGKGRSHVGAKRSQPMH